MPDGRSDTPVNDPRALLRYEFPPLLVNSEEYVVETVLRSAGFTILAGLGGPESFLRLPAASGAPFRFFDCLTPSFSRSSARTW